MIHILQVLGATAPLAGRLGAPPRWRARSTWQEEGLPGSHYNTRGAWTPQFLTTSNTPWGCGTTSASGGCKGVQWIPRLPSCQNTTEASGLRKVNGPPGRSGTATPLISTPQTLLLIGKDVASNRRGPIRTEKGREVIEAEKGPPDSKMPKLEARAEGSSLALMPRQFTVPVATTLNH